MHRMLLGLTLAAFALAGCTKAEEAAAEAVGRVGAKGRFVGVGIYSPGRMWNQLSRPTPASPADPAAATLKDDDHVIVVIDTATGASPVRRSQRPLPDVQPLGEDDVEPSRAGGGSEASGSVAGRG